MELRGLSKPKRTPPISKSGVSEQTARSGGWRRATGALTIYSAGVAAALEVAERLGFPVQGEPVAAASVALGGLYLAIKLGKRASDSKITTDLKAVEAARKVPTKKRAEWLGISAEKKLSEKTPDEVRAEYAKFWYIDKAWPESNLATPPDETIAGLSPLITERLKRRAAPPQSGFGEPPEIE